MDRVRCCCRTPTEADAIPETLSLDTILSITNAREWLVKEAEHPLYSDNEDVVYSDTVPLLTRLEMMRAHLHGVTLPTVSDNSVFSAVLFGPPGLRDVPLTESLARSSGVPLVEVRLSDLTAGSSRSVIEDRMHSCFLSLTMLTRVVIVMKNVESFLVSRHTSNATSELNLRPEAPEKDDLAQRKEMFRMIGPGMLPKLSRLYHAAKRQRFVYCLITDQVEKMDPAFIRPGRFDARSAIHYPHLLSRIRFLSRALSAITDLSRRLAEFIADDPESLWEIEWRDLERTLAAVFEGIGFSVELTPGSKDEGKDIVLQCRIGVEEYSYIVEVKHWRSGKKVGSGYVSDFVKVVAREEHHGGLFLSSSGYADEIAAMTQVDRERVRLGNEQKIVSLCKTYKMCGSGVWLNADVLPQILFADTE